jgi:RNA methyltransferase, TrmH family
MSLKQDRKLVEKKYRDETGLFLVEGRKGILELLESNYLIERLYMTLEASEEFDPRIATYRERMNTPLPQVTITTHDRLESAGTFRSNNAGIAIAVIPTREDVHSLYATAKQEFVLVLDDVRDPGNLGTIIRIADWFNVRHIVTSDTTTDTYSPKTIASSMGSFTRIHVTELPLIPFLRGAKDAAIEVAAAVLDGTDIRTAARIGCGLIVMGSESHGVSEEVLPFIDTKLTIPRYGNAESLNVGVATAIILAELRRDER